MSFGLLGDFLFGLVVAALFGAWLDRRKSALRKKREAPLPPPPSVFTPAETISARAALDRSRRHGGGDGFVLPDKEPTVELPLKVKKVKSWR